MLTSMFHSKAREYYVAEVVTEIYDAFLSTKGLLCCKGFFPHLTEVSGLSVISVLTLQSKLGGEICE
jgi:hypothetical protein